MAELTKEWLQQTIAELEEERDAVPGVVNEDAAMTLAAMKLALASIEVEPVCVIDQSNLDYLNAGSDADVWPVSRTEMGDVLLYRTAPPAPVSVPAAMEMDDDFDSAFEHGKAVGWNAYRAAMLQGANGTLTNEVTMPANTPCKEAPEHIWLQTAGVWPENGEFGELTWCSDNQHEDDTLYVRADVASGNSPVVPDGWVMVPIEPTEHMIVEGFESEPDEFFSDEEVWEAYDAMSGCQQAAHRAKLCWAAMIKAAPKLE